MKATDILNAYVHNWTHFKIYLHITDMGLLDKTIITTMSGKQFEGCYGTLKLNQRATRKAWDKQVPCDIIRKDDWFIDLLDRGYNIQSVDKTKQLKFQHFEIDENGELVFVYKLDMKQVEKIFDDYNEAYDWVRR